MPKLSFSQLNIIFWGSIVTFVTSGLISTQVVQKTQTIEALLQALAVTILVIILVTKFVIKRFQDKNPNLAYFIQFVPLTLFVYLLVFSTGGLASPFLILTHLFAIGMAFLISPGVSMVYVLTTAVYLIVNMQGDPTAQQLIADSPFAVFLYVLAYGAILPFSQYIAKIYKAKEAAVKELTGMLVSTKKEEERLIKNIDEAVLILAPDTTVTFANQAVWEKTYFKPEELTGKKLSTILKFKDSNGKLSDSAKLPIAAIVKTKSESKVDNMQIGTKQGNFIAVDFKFLPIVEADNSVSGVIMIIYDQTEKEKKTASAKQLQQKPERPLA